MSITPGAPVGPVGQYFLTISSMIRSIAIGGAATGVLTLCAPVLAVIGAMAPLVAKVKVDIVRESGAKDG